MGRRSVVERLAAVVLMPIALAGCLAGPAEGPIGADPPASACDASSFAGFVGQSRDVLLATTFARPIRIIDPGELVTQEFDPLRINFVIDRRGTIERVYCG